MDTEDTNPMISIIIPTYNGGKTLSVTLARIKDILRLTFQSYELIVVNDGSIDNTLEVLQREEKLDSKVRIISYDENRGKGYAVKTGVMHSIGDTIMFIDGDFESYSYFAIKDCIGELETCDIVIASKRHPS